MPTMTPPLDDVRDWLRRTAPGAHLSADSRLISPGDVFFAYPGDAGDGRRHIGDAVERGAAAVLFEAEGYGWESKFDVPHMGVPDLKYQAGYIANVYYGRPDADMFSVAVTGTNGKTSCSQWLGHALSEHGEPTAVIGTLGTGIYRNGQAGEFSITGYTTPDAVQLQRRLADMRAAGAAALAFEASSIGLHQGRMNGLHVDAALFTNFTRDHLDYHKDMASYEAAKTMLFDWPGLRHAVINLDDEMGLRLVRHLQEKHPSVTLIGYTLCDRAVPDVQVLRGTDIRSAHAGTNFQLHGQFGAVPVHTQLIGKFNISNVLGVIGVLLSKGIAWETAIDLAESLLPVPGRMQQLGGHDNPLVVIDYAHTPDALEKAISTLRDVAQQRGGRLWCVFGCGGDRDPGKRPQMGAMATLSDHVVVTSDNPRSENALSIIQQILEGMKNTKAMQSPPQSIEDRAAAILWAVKHAAKADVVLLAGKGHETYQEIKGKKLPFLDADHAALALAARATMKGAA